MKFDPDKLERLADLLDGVDDEAAEEARQMASDIRKGLPIEGEP
jgi:hypothetical protein